MVKRNNRGLPLSLQEAAAERLKQQRLQSMNVNVLKARKETAQRRALSATEEATECTRLRFFSSRVIQEVSTRGPAIAIDLFPVEIKLQMLNSLPDIRSLHSLISSSRAFYDCYNHDRNRCEVFCRVLVNEMTLPIFLQAIAISSKSVRKMKWKGKNLPNGIQNLHNFMRKYSKDLKATTFNPRSYDLKTMIRIAKFHLTIKAISQDYFESCLGLHPWTHEKYEKKELERVETLRIQRALYNVELYPRSLKHAGGYLKKQCTLSRQIYGETGIMPVRGLHRSFLEHFSLWEAEGMVSILDYMEREYHYILQDCKSFLTTSSQAQLYGSPSTLANIRWGEHVRTCRWNVLTNRFNIFDQVLITMGTGYFWKVCKQNVPTAAIPILDSFIQRILRTPPAVNKVMVMFSYLEREYLYIRSGLAPRSRHIDLKAIDYSALDCWDVSLQALNLPSSRATWIKIDEFVSEPPIPQRDFLSSFGYCMWTQARVNHNMEVFQPPSDGAAKWEL
ncbi:hypothetical protein OCU04_003002 [Sclerotinia nivalis]|uniref:Uncharacterized protein n=1 Tax=Sclerotinia nivalis TaxID=352851 RepID=A0A9X0DPP1_9HELO|nr:hypothetical protein OCU04_003002 [Sclerotinia nivalis]